MALAVELVGRRADCHTGQHGILIAPGIKAVASNPDCHVEIESYRHSLRAQPALFKLRMGEPLNEVEEFDCSLVIPAQPNERAFAGPAIFVRPFPPGFGEFAPQEFKAGESVERRWMISLKLLE